MKRDTWHRIPFRRTGLASPAAVLIAIVAQSSVAHAQQPTFADFPTVIYCEYEGIANAYYFSQLGSDGRAIYLTPDRQAGAITLDGVAMHIEGDRSGSCADKTLDDLRAAGQAFDLPH